MADLPDILIRPARREDLAGLAQVFVAAFPESVAHVAGSLSTTHGLEDMFALMLDAEPAALQVAEQDGRLAGYVLSPSRTSRLRSVAIWHGHVLRSAWRWLTGQYGVRWRAIFTSLGDKLTFLRSARVGERSEARILSLAVHPDYQGQGLGKRLLAAGLDYLRSQGVPAVRLEVRPDNGPAKHLYLEAGFQEVGTYSDAQGPWLVMIKRFQPRPRPRARRRRWRRWVLAAAILVVAGWSFSSFLLNRPLYLANLRLRVQMPFLTVPGAGSRLLIFAPHPDDETLGCGGLIQQAQEAGAEVYVVLMTNGDASEYALMYWEKAVRRTAQEYLGLGRIRERESRAGLEILDLPPGHLFTLGYPNAGLEKLWQPSFWLPARAWTSPYTRVARNPYGNTLHPGAPYCGSQVLSDVRRLLATVKPDMVLAPAPFDVHPDHWATYDFVRLAMEQRALRQEGKTPRLYCYLVHRRDWPAPVGYHPHELLQPPADFAHGPHLKWFALPLSEEQVQRKTRALSMYRSQAPQWDRLLLAMVRHNELFAELTPLDYGDPEATVVEHIRDQPALRARPSADLALLNLRLQGSSASVSLVLAGKVDPRLTYVVLGHCPQAREPIAWELQAQGATGTLTWVQGNALHSQTVPITIQQDLLSAALPLAFVRERLLLVEAFTTIGHRYLDHTTTRQVALEPQGSGQSAGTGAP
jgi:LmbE family N-acetylglucosaminyl deacetylase/ribosomal protein S18 acetylase RimI-like enzyme